MKKPTVRPQSQGGGPLFNEPVADNGYLWFYIDALSDDGKYALTIIAFVGCVFSPFYAKARRENPAGVNPMNHCAINIALYAGVDGQAVNRHDLQQWAMTECSSADGTSKVEISKTRFKVSSTTLNWDGQQLTIDIDELSIPFPAPKSIQAPFSRPVRGKVVVTPLAIFNESHALDVALKHQWRPIAPLSRVEVQMVSPDITWQGAAYWDSNAGSEPLEAAFRSWNWSRTKPTKTNAATDIIYHLMRYGATKNGTKDSTTFKLAKRFSVTKTGGKVADFVVPPDAALSQSAWGIPRHTVCDALTIPTVIKTVEDTPFYARSIVSTSMNGAHVTMFHESLLLTRFSTRWVQALLPFKIRRS
jgi:carotenoid 1,2-hydratase